VPNGTLFGDGVAARIKEELLKEFNLHTIVRLPNGVFAPYTSIPTNILFFDRSGPTREVWYYEQPLPEGRKQYTKTTPMRFEEFADLLAWWRAPEGRQENARAWRVPAQSILDTAATWTLRTLARSKISPTYRRRSWRRVSSTRSGASPRSWPRSSGCWRRERANGKHGGSVADGGAA